MSRSQTVPAETPESRRPRLLAWAAARWRRECEARELAALQDRELRDIGATGYEVAQLLGAGARWWRQARAGH